MFRIRNVEYNIQRFLTCLKNSLLAVDFKLSTANRSSPRPVAKSPRPLSVSIRDPRDSAGGSKGGQEETGSRGTGNGHLSPAMKKKTPSPKARKEAAPGYMETISPSASAKGSAKGSKAGSENSKTEGPI